MDPYNDPRRPERVAGLRSTAIREGLKGSLIYGTVGIGCHFLAQKFWPWYRTKFYIQGKTFAISAFFVAGYWIYGEKAAIAYMDDIAEQNKQELHEKVSQTDSFKHTASRA